MVTVSSGAVEVTGQNLDQQLGPNQSLRLSGSNPVYAEQVQLFPPDGLDQFDQERERRRQRAAAYQYVSQDMIGAGDLDDYGDWQPPNQDNQGYGAVWYPRGVPARLDPLLERPLGLGCSLGLDVGGGRAVGFCALPLWPLGQLRGTLGLGPRTASLSLRRRNPADLLARPGSLCGRGRRRHFHLHRGRRRMVPARPARGLSSLVSRQPGLHVTAST